MEEDYQSKFEETRASKARYWQALGEFVDCFARLEVTLRRFLFKLIGLDSAVGRVVTAGWRADTLATYILRVNELNSLPGVDAEFVKEAIKRFSSINTVRNAILHSGAIWKDEQLIITNFFTARTPAHRRDLIVEVSSLEEMSSDLSKMIAHFIVFSISTKHRPREKMKHLLDRMVQ